VLRTTMQGGKFGILSIFFGEHEIDYGGESEL
jgi:hypothetical protein